MTSDEINDWVHRNAGSPNTEEPTLREFVLLQQYNLLATATQTPDIFSDLARAFFHRGALYPTVFAKCYFAAPYDFYYDHDEWGRQLRERCFAADVEAIPDYVDFLMDTVAPVSERHSN